LHFLHIDFGLKLVQACYGLKSRQLPWIVCKGVKQSLNRIGVSAGGAGLTRPLICGLVNRAEAATSREVAAAFGFADALAPDLYRSAEKSLWIGLGCITGKA